MVHIDAARRADDVQATRLLRQALRYAPGAEEVEPFDVDVSSNGGASWVPLESTFTREALWSGKDFDLTTVLSSFSNVHTNRSAVPMQKAGELAQPN